MSTAAMMKQTAITRRSFIRTSHVHTRGVRAWLTECRIIRPRPPIQAVTTRHDVGCSEQGGVNAHETLLGGTAEGKTEAQATSPARAVSTPRASSGRRRGSSD